MIKVIQRIPTENYAYLELNIEYETVEEAFIDHQRLLKLHSAGAGLDARTWKKVREKMLTDGTFDPNLSEQLNHAQRWYINELKLSLRALTPKDTHEELETIETD